MSFDYEEVERDILNAGADPDYLDYNHPDKRDEYLQEVEEMLEDLEEED